MPSDSCVSGRSSLVQQGGVSVNDEKVADVNAMLAQELFAGEGVIIKKGKKVFHRAAKERGPPLGPCPPPPGREPGWSAPKPEFPWPD